MLKNLKWDAHHLRRAEEEKKTVKGKNELGNAQEIDHPGNATKSVSAGTGPEKEIVADQEDPGE